MGLAEYEAEVLSDSPAGFWPMQGDATASAVDESGNGADLTWINSPTFEASGPISGAQAVTFNGTNQRGEAYHASFPLLSDDTVSLELWFLSASASTFRTIAVWRRPDLSSAEGLLAGLNSASNGNIRAYRLGAFRTTGAGSVNDSSWHHLVLTHNASTGVNVYLDGSLLQAGSPATTTNAGAVAVNFGSNIATGGGGSPIQFFAGSICYGALYATELTSAQISDHYDAMFAASGTPSGAVSIGATAVSATRGTLTLHPTGAVSLGALSVTGAVGTVAIAMSAAVALDGLTASATATPDSGATTAQVSLGGITATGAVGSQLLHMAANVALGGLTLTANPTVTISSTATISLGGVTIGATSSIPLPYPSRGNLVLSERVVTVTSPDGQLSVQVSLPRLTFTPSANYPWPTITYPDESISITAPDTTVTVTTG